MRLAAPAALLAILLAPPSAARTPAAPARELTPSPSPVEPRAKEALGLFGRDDDDRAICWRTWGPPRSRLQLKCPRLLREVEVWTWAQHPILGRSAPAVFFAEPGTGIFRYWTVLDGEAALLSAAAAPGRPLSEVPAVEFGCPELAALQESVRAVSSRQVDNTAGLRERGEVLKVPTRLEPAARERTDPKSPAPVAAVADASGPPAIAPSGRAAAQPAPAGAAAPPVLVSNRPLGDRERRRLTAALPERYRQFLADVEPILTDLERDTFLRLSSDPHRDKFLEDFWKRRSVDKDGMRVPFRDIYELRLREVKERFRNVNTDMGRIFLVNGPPDGLRKIDCQDIYWPLQIWYYEHLESLRMSKVLLLFYQPFSAGDYRLWTPMDGVQALRVGGIAGMTIPGVSARTDPTRCVDWRDVSAAINTVTAQLGSAGSLKIVAELKEGPKPDVEGVDRVLLLTTDMPEGAARLPVQRTIRFPEMAANKLRMEIAIVVEKAALSTKPLGEEAFYDLDVVGEIVKAGRLVDNFRYRFDFPASTVSGPWVPVTVERELYPGEYQLKVKVADANRNAAAVLQEKLTVPESPDGALNADERAARAAARTTVAQLVTAPEGPKGSISLVPIAREIATGLVRFEARTTSADVISAEFHLDGVRVVTKRRPPFEADLDLGELPRRHVVRVVAYARDGKALSQDEMILNEGREAFRVRIVSPEKGLRLRGAVRVVADVAVPETKRLKEVEFFVNETRAAALFQPPFQQVVDVPGSRDLGFLRVVAHLEDGSVTEDLRYYNAPRYLSEVNVRAVELYTSVFDRGRPVTGLPKESFAVLEDGEKQDLEGFEVVQNLPLSLGIGIDTSGSMEESIIEAQKAATGFLRAVMTPRDRCFLVSFDNEPQLVSRFTTDKNRLAQALAGTRAQGSTALWDALVYGLYQYQGTKGRKAYVILTDGEDRASRFTFGAALDYARKSGVSIYFIGLRIPTIQFAVRGNLNRIARETGGAVYFVESASNLSEVYREVDEELRNQYLLSYVPRNPPAGSKWRKVDVKMTPSNLVARTISGYYP